MGNAVSAQQPAQEPSTTAAAAAATDSSSSSLPNGSASGVAMGRVFAAAQPLAASTSSTSAPPKNNSTPIDDGVPSMTQCIAELCIAGLYDSSRIPAEQFVDVAGVRGLGGFVRASMRALRDRHNSKKVEAATALTTPPSEEPKSSSQQRELGAPSVGSLEFYAHTDVVELLQGCETLIQSMLSANFMSPAFIPTSVDDESAPPTTLRSFLLPLSARPRTAAGDLISTLAGVFVARTVLAAIISDLDAMAQDQIAASVGRKECFRRVEAVLQRVAVGAVRLLVSHDVDDKLEGHAATTGESLSENQGSSSLRLLGLRYALHCECLDLLSLLQVRSQCREWFSVMPGGCATIDDAVRDYARLAGSKPDEVEIDIISRLLNIFASRAACPAWTPNQEHAETPASGGLLSPSRVAILTSISTSITTMIYSPVGLAKHCGDAYDHLLYLKDPLSYSRTNSVSLAHVTESPRSDKALALLLLLLSSESGDDSGPANTAQPWRQALRKVHDPEYSPATTITAGSSIAVSARSIVDAIAHNTFKTWNESHDFIPMEFDSTAILLLYYLMRDFAAFTDHVVSRVDTHAALVLPLCRICYELTRTSKTPQDQQPHFDDLYLCVVSLLLLMHDSSVASSQFTSVLRNSADLQFFSERPQLALELHRRRPGEAELSSGDAILLCLARAVQLNLSRMPSDDDDDSSSRSAVHVQHAALAAMANLMPWAQHMHPYTCSRVVKLLEIVGRRQSRKNAQFCDAETPADAKRELQRELAVYSDMLHLLFKMVNSTLSHSVRANPYLVYQLLYRQDALQHWFGDVMKPSDHHEDDDAARSVHARYADLAQNIFIAIEFFNTRIVEAVNVAAADSVSKSAGSSAVAQLASGMSQTDVIALVEAVLAEPTVLHSLNLAPFGQLSFKYQEERHPEKFFKPYARRVVAPKAFSPTLFEHQEIRTTVVVGEPQ